MSYSKAKVIKGTSDRPRISIFKSNHFLYAQVIDDTIGQTICAESSLKYNESKLMVASQLLGKNLALKIKEAKIDQVVFDRGKYKYTGSIKVLADAMRENGIQF